MVGSSSKEDLPTNKDIYKITNGLYSYGNLSDGAFEKSEESWAEDTKEERQTFIDDIFKHHNVLLDGFFDHANQCVKSYLHYTKLHGRWRKTIISSWISGTTVPW